MNTLFTEIPSVEPLKQESDNLDKTSFFVEFLNKLEGYKTKCKNLHWAAPKKNIHVYLDDFLSIVSDYQDSLAEDYQGILGHIRRNARRK